MEAGQDAERELILKVAAGDRAAFAALVDRTHAGLFRYLRSLVRSDEVAEDVLQETCLGVWRGAAGYRGEAPGRVWLYGVARRLAARTWRRRAGEPVDALPLEALAVEAGFGDGADPEALTAGLEDRERVRRALDRLPDADRELVVLRDLEGFTGPEVAGLLGLELANAKTRLHRARLKLLAEVRAGGGDDVG